MAYLTVTFSLGYIRPTVVVTTHLEAYPDSEENFKHKQDALLMTSRPV